MHIEILVEDKSGKEALELLVPMIIGSDHTFNIKSYKGIGKIPKNLVSSQNVRSMSLLNDLPRLLKGYGKTFIGYGPSYHAAVVVVCDLDDDCMKELLNNLKGILDNCFPAPHTVFCIAIEEGEAWLLGDMDAIKRAYPHAKNTVLCEYINDSICGTWEILADAIYPGGSRTLDKQGYQQIGEQKSIWARTITPFMNINENKSPSFNYFRGKLIQLVTSQE